jgi:UDPglucose 6-dehydrogenase
MKIAILGTGYVGLVSGACFADFGHSVHCVDKDVSKIEALQRGHIPIYEPGLKTLVESNLRQRRLAFGLDLKPAIADADAVFIAVGTPSRRGDGFADLSYIYAAARDIAEEISKYTVIVVKSTAPVGTGDEVERLIRQARPDADFSVASNPEFLREGAAISDFKRPDRILIGVDDERAAAILSEVYRPLYLNRAPIVKTSRRTAELTKYAANAFLAMKITFINEIADLCERAGADVQQLAHCLGLDNRIGSKFLHAGPGYGGSCFPKDTLALIKSAQDLGAPLRLIETVIAVNEQRKRAMARKVVAACGGSVRGKIIAVLGLTFKPNTDDMRESPALDIVTGLHDHGAIVRAFDPRGMDEARPLLPDLIFASDAYDCAKGAEALVIVTEWDAFRALDFAVLKATMSKPVLVDLRNVYPPDHLRGSGFSHVSIGRPGI